jgi:hypothetical protein
MPQRPRPALRGAARHDLVEVAEKWIYLGHFLITLMNGPNDRWAESYFGTCDFSV